MVQQVIKDGKGRDRTLNIQGFIKPSGMVVAKVVTDDKSGKKHRYFVQGNKCSCDGNNKWDKQCYHLKGVAMVANQLPTYEQAVAIPVEVAMQEAQDEMKRFEKSMSLDYDDLASTKKVAVQRAMEPDTCCYCGRICKGELCGSCAA